jgi:putative ATP-dependent endonuclease of the OLD family
MIIESVHVKNFRSILDERLYCDSLTALVGRNGAGKSSFLRAMELFYEPSGKVTEEDFYAEDTNQDIEIALTFSKLENEERIFFSAYIDNETLTVVRVFSLVPGHKSGTYHGMRLQNPEFTEVRTAGGKREITAKYNELRNTEKYSALPSVRSAEQVLVELQKWESKNLGACSRLRDDGQFFGFTEVGQGYLGRFTRFIRIPAVRDASEDAAEGRGSCVTELMDLVVRSVLANREDVTSFKEQTQVEYKDIMEPSKLTELTTLETRLSQTLRYYVSDASVSLQWAALAEIKIPMPEAEVKLLEDGYKSSVQRTGHGLQRAFILTMLQHLVAAQESEKATEIDATPKVTTQELRETTIPNFVLAIEEPELYQHPSRQRHLASVLLQLATGIIPGVAKKTQVIYTTHEPLFVGLDRFDQIRILRKVNNETDKPKITKVTKTTLNEVAEILWNIDKQQGNKYTAATLRPRVQAVMTPWMNEGFFADVVVLVEGESDRATLLKAAMVLGYDFESIGICVIPCMGKNNIDRPTCIFRKLGIQTYLIWDNDKDAKTPNPDDNKKLLRLVEATEEDWPTGVWNKHACFDNNLETILIREINSQVFDYHFNKAKDEFRLEKDRTLKNPFAMNYIIGNCYKEGHQSSTLNAIIEKIRLLCYP